MMGCSNPHPHGQVRPLPLLLSSPLPTSLRLTFADTPRKQAWSLSYVPTIPAAMLKNQREYAVEHAGAELEKGVPTLCVSASVAPLPFADLVDGGSVRQR